MPSEKSRPINPAAAQRKLEKTRALRKSKAAIQVQRTARLATRNPLRLEQTIASLKSLQDSQGGKLGPQEKKALEDAERDLVRVRKARETVGAKDGPPGINEEGGGGGGGRGRGAGGQGSGVKRLRKEMEGKNKGERKSEEEEEEEDEETDEDVRRIPMPRDTPPPIPRRPHPRPASTSASASNANLEPLGPARLPPSSYKPDDITTTTTTTTISQSPAPAPASVPAPAIIKIYESAPQVRDLRREAVASFVPEVVRRKLDAVRGKGKLLEEEELRELEKGGYTNVVGGGSTSATGGNMKKKDRGDEEEEDEFRKEEERFEREVRMVASVEEVDDDEDE